MRARQFVLAGTVILAGCVGADAWQRIDGRAVDPQQIRVDLTICRGERQQALLSAGPAAPMRPGIGGGMEAAGDDLGRAAAANDVGSACMARRGYIEKN